MPMVVLSSDEENDEEVMEVGRVTVMFPKGYSTQSDTETDECSPFLSNTESEREISNGDKMSNVPYEHSPMFSEVDELNCRNVTDCAEDGGDKDISIIYSCINIDVGQIVTSFITSTAVSPSKGELEDGEMESQKHYKSDTLEKTMAKLSFTESSKKPNDIDMDKVSEKGQQTDGHSRVNHKQPESKSDRIIIHDESSIDSTSSDYKLELIHMNTEEIQRLSLPEKQNEDKVDTTPCEGTRDVQEEDDSRIQKTDTNTSENSTIGSKEALLACLNLGKDADTSFLDPLFNRQVRDWDDENNTWDRPWRRHHSSDSDDEVHVLTMKNLRSRKVTVMKMMEPKKQKKSRKRKSEN